MTFDTAIISRRLIPGGTKWPSEVPEIPSKHSDRRNRTFALTLGAVSTIITIRAEPRSGVLWMAQCDGCDLSLFV
jgi:hypothetical protein